MANEGTTLSATEQLLKKYTKRIVMDVRENLGLADDDESQDEHILSMPRSEVLDRVLTWNGLINYGYTLRKWVKGIYGVDLDDRETVEPDTQIGSRGTRTVPRS